MIKTEIFVADEGLPSERVVCRTFGMLPALPGCATLNDIISHQTSLPAEISEYLTSLMESQRRQLATEVGERWANES